MKRSTYIFLILGIASCQTVEKTTATVTPFFDTGLFIEAEFPTSASKTKSVQKIINYNGAIESKHIDNYDISQDLELLKSANINNPSWSDKYKIDSIQNANNKMEVVYSSLDSKMRISSLKAQLDNGQVVGFQAELTRNALIATSTKTISYRSKEGYKISTDSKGVATEDRVVVIEVKFNPL